MPFKNPHPLYTVWQGMKRRCDNPNFKQFSDYGGRGIYVCDRWKKSFANFLADMGPRPEGYTLDRINNDGPYSPDNCRWASRKTQQRNQTRTRKVVIGGVEYIVAELAEKSGLKTDTIAHRAAQGLSFAEVIAPERRVFLGGWSKAYKRSMEVRAARTHCKNGHEWTVENTYFTKEGWRNCRRCACEKMRRITAAKRLANE